MDFTILNYFLPIISQKGNATAQPIIIVPPADPILNENYYPETVILYRQMTDDYRLSLNAGIRNYPVGATTTWIISGAPSGDIAPTGITITGDQLTFTTAQIAANTAGRYKQRFTVLMTDINGDPVTFALNPALTNRNLVIIEFDIRDGTPVPHFNRAYYPTEINLYRADTVSFRMDLWGGLSYIDDVTIQIESERIPPGSIGVRIQENRYLEIYYVHTKSAGTYRERITIRATDSEGNTVAFDDGETVKTFIINFIVHDGSQGAPSEPPDAPTGTTSPINTGALFTNKAEIPLFTNKAGNPLFRNGDE